MRKALWLVRNSDTTPPTVSGVTNGNTYGAAGVSPTFTEGTATLDGAPFVSGTLVTANGPHVLIVTDAVGNAATVNFTVDTTAPAQPTLATATVLGGANVTIVAPANGETAWLAASGTTSFTAGATMTKLVGDGTTNTILAPAKEGDYVLYLIDDAGNISQPSSGVLTVDNLPTAQIWVTNTATALNIAVSNANGKSDPLAITNDNIASENVSIQGQNTSGGTFSITNSGGGLINGDSFTFSVTDETGNVSSYTATWDSGTWSLQ